ncbi:hypothetical protein H4219_005368 [Mycoemilia scoparia]|uniref:Uncharacterized protein n=1 Tax=Mycoemilia scoparia TaxID=417184 RepID=A0A9W7ZXW7_9FUNG|nr:hypothetical protein H4219_005368 [Mycoemilia scoparia]
MAALRCSWRNLILLLIVLLVIQFVIYFSPVPVIDSKRLEELRNNYFNRRPAQKQGHVSSSRNSTASYDPARFNSRPVRENAVFAILVRNGELGSLVESLKQLEEKFNKRFHYPYVLLNEQPFTEEFKAGIKEVVSGKVEFGLIPSEHWSYPAWIDQEKARLARVAMKNVIYGGSEPYRHMCRFNSGFFYRHHLLDQYDWYWRVEPGVKFPCIIPYDPFRFMRENNKLYGYTITIKEFKETIPTLWKTTQNFMRENSDTLASPNMLEFVEKVNGAEVEYNGCHFWSNFEVASLNFLRSEVYNKYFDYLDQAGGFFYERWGDAPVHSLGVAMFMDKSQVHWFDDIGYFHGPLWNCPKGEMHKKLQCDCLEKKSIEKENQNWSCINEFNALPNIPGTTSNKVIWPPNLI